ncbi:hypothetical protein HHI36_015097 [Cryptolaemus montrouzieri]|uniref:Uncharacterized protein n=1 Tax=Cryptolaemus montrouzieri TaxID=559131 RepID=A0ABD2N535_9CUCU
MEKIATLKWRWAGHQARQDEERWWEKMCMKLLLIVDPMKRLITTLVSEASTLYSSNTMHKSTRKRKGVPADDGTTDIMKLVGKKLESLQIEDAFQLFGKHVANKLRDVSSSQNAIATRTELASTEHIPSIQNATNSFFTSWTIPLLLAAVAAYATKLRPTTTISHTGV